MSGTTRLHCHICLNVSFLAVCGVGSSIQELRIRPRGSYYFFLVLHLRHSQIATSLNNSTSSWKLKMRSAALKTAYPYLLGYFPILAHGKYVHLWFLVDERLTMIFHAPFRTRQWRSSKASSFTLAAACSWLYVATCHVRMSLPSGQARLPCCYLPPAGEALAKLQSELVYF